MERGGGSRLLQIQARFQQRQMLEKEQKMVAMYEAQQARTLGRVLAAPATPVAPTPTAVAEPPLRVQPGKVRQMFEERRTKAGIDKSYPLQPIQNNGDRNNQPRKQLPNGYVKIAVTKTKVVGSKTSKTGVNNNTHSIRKQRQEHLTNGAGDLNQNTQLDPTAIKTSNNNHWAEQAERLADSDRLDGEHLMERLDNLDDETFPEAMAPSPTPRTPEPAKVTRAPPPERRSPAVNKSPSKARARASPPAPAVTSPRRTDQAVVKQSPARNEKSPRTAMIRSTPQPMSASKVRNSANAKSVAEAGAESAGGGTGDPCSVCGRRFASDRLQKHEEICKKAQTKKRKPYDALKHRLVGTEAEPFIRQLRKQPPAKASQSQQKATKSANWRQKHEDFIRAIRAAKQVQAHVAAGGKLSDLPPPPPSENPDYVQCPHCSRRFNQAAAERHIPKCRDYQYNKPKPQAAKRR